MAHGEMTSEKQEPGSASSAEAYAHLRADERAGLVDVRTSAEWTFVGVPDLSGIGRKVFFAEWQGFPSMTVDPKFAETLARRLADAGVEPDAPLYFLCRSGARSLSAARAMTAAGYTRCINVSDGFEGGMDEARHRSRVNGWKAAGLPWVQS